jgi:hypothetical protein
MTFLDENESHINIHISCVPLGAILCFSELPPGLHIEKDYYVRWVRSKGLRTETIEKTCSIRLLHENYSISPG